MQSTTLEQLTPTAAQTILENLPERIRAAFIDRAAEINYPVEAVVEMALAGYLDSESIGFVDCKPNRGRG
jgi:flagellar motor switch protein FliG